MTENTEPLSRKLSWITIIPLAALIMLGVFGLFSRWATPIDLLSPNGAGTSFASLVDFPVNYGRSFNTNFIFRDSLIRMDYWMRYFVLHETVFPQVLMGRDGWMYYTHEGNLDYYQRVHPLTEAQQQSIRDNLLSIQSKLEKDGIRFLFVIAPNKETIYPEYLPDGIVRAENPTWADQVLVSLDGTGIPILDLRNTMLAEKEKAPVYFKTDTHWNPIGARAAYEAILLALQPDFPILKPHPLSDFDQVTESTSGDLAGLIHLKGDITEPFTALHARFEKPSRGLKNPPAGQMITVMPDQALPKAVIFRDSFFNGLQPFTSEHFSRVVYVSDFSVDLGLVAEEKPDVVILELAERYLDHLIEPDGRP